MSWNGAALWSLLGLAFAVSSSSAQGPLDGEWVVQLATQAGPCARTTPSR
jgi:hypothetical protein